MAEVIECRFCQRWQPATACCDKQRRQAEKGRRASCLECERAIAALRRLANLARAQCEHADAGAPPMKIVTDESRGFWEQGLDQLLGGAELGDGCGGSDAWLPGMLRRWLEQGLEFQHSAAPAEKTQARVKAADPAGETQAALVEELPAWLDELRAERVLRYDADTFPFEQVFRDMFETSDLASLHQQELREESPPLCPTLFRSYVNAGIKRPRAWRQSTKWEGRYVARFRRSAEYRRFAEVYHRFIRQVVVPLLGRGELLYQCPPTFRCQMPSLLPSCSPHRDSDYAAHHRAEVNFWVPVSPAFGSNSLQVESEPGKEDFHPLELGPGEMAIFNGSRCLHYTEANRTGSVRVSFDFRVIPECLLDGRDAGHPRLVQNRNSTRGAATYQYEYLSTSATQTGCE